MKAGGSVHLIVFSPNIVVFRLFLSDTHFSEVFSTILPLEYQLIINISLISTMLLLSLTKKSSNWRYYQQIYLVYDQFFPNIHDFRRLMDYFLFVIAFMPFIDKLIILNVIFHHRIPFLTVLCFLVVYTDKFISSGRIFSAKIMSHGLDIKFFLVISFHSSFYVAFIIRIAELPCSTLLSRCFIWQTFNFSSLVTNQSALISSFGILPCESGYLPRLLCCIL